MDRHAIRQFIPALWPVLLFPLLSCSGGGPRALHVQLTAEPVTLDPARAEDLVSMKVLGNTMDGLMGYDGAGRLEPRLAESFKISENGRRYEFTLRKDAKWSDGKQVKATEFVAAFRRSLARDTLSKLAPVLFPIRNAREYHEGKVSADQLGVSAETGQDREKLVVELEEPVSYFIHVMTLTLALPIREELIRANGGNWSESFPVTGPYAMTKHLIEQKIVIEKNPFTSVPVSIPRVEFDIVPDESTGVHLFENGKLDILSKIPDADYERLKRQGWIRSDRMYAVYYLAFNVKKPPFDDVKSRRAVAWAVQKQELAEIFHTGDTAANSWIPAGLEGFFDEKLPSLLSPADIARAKSGFSRLAPVLASFDTSSRNSLMLEKIQHDLATQLSLKLSLENMDWKSYIRSLQTDSAPLFRFGWLAPFNDPTILLEVFETGNPSNYSHFSNPDYDRLVGEIVRLEPGAERDAKLKDAQEILLSREAVVIPIYHYMQNHAVSSRVLNFHVNPFGIVRFSDLSLKMLSGTEN